MWLLGLITALLMCLGGLALVLVLLATVFGEHSLAYNFMAVLSWGPMSNLFMSGWALTALFFIASFIGSVRTAREEAERDARNDAYYARRAETDPVLRKSLEEERRKKLENS